MRTITQYTVSQFSVVFFCSEAITRVFAEHKCLDLDQRWVDLKSIEVFHMLSTRF